MAEGNSLVNLGDLSKPVNTLVKKIASAVGILYEPQRIINKAKAEAKAEEIMEINKLNINDLKKRTIQRVINEESVKQKNIENIIGKTIPLVQNNANANNISNDWLLNFFEKSRLVSDDDMQTLWGKILAGETNNPRTFSKLTLKIISELEKSDAELFTSLASTSFYIDNEPNIIVFFHDIDEEDRAVFYQKCNITFASLAHLETIGLIKFNGISGFITTKLPKQIELKYFEQKFILIMRNDENNTLETGDVILTKAGKELIGICGAVPNEEIKDFTLKIWEKRGITVM